MAFTNRLATRSGALIIVALAWLGCASEDPEERLEAAADRVSDARESASEKVHGLVDEIEDLEHEQRDVREAEAEVEKARMDLAEASKRLEQAVAKLNRRANDVAIFRSVQRSLLDEDRLDHAAISADVSGRTVTLRGDVRDESDRERAIEIAKETPGVRQVRDEMAVRTHESAGAREPETPASGETTG